MTWYQMARDWTEFEVMVKEKWCKLTDEDLRTFGGNSDQLSGLLQHRYGYARDQAEREINEFSNEPKR